MTQKNQRKIQVETGAGYNAWANHYDLNPSHTVVAARQALLQLLPDLAGKTVLEVGCGTGENFAQLSGRGIKSAIGLDFSAGMLAKARQKQFDFPAYFAQHDVQRVFPVATASVDVVIISLVLEHLADIQFTFSELSRILVDGGESLLVELHPFRALSGGFARFADSLGETEYCMKSNVHSIADLLNSHLQNSFRLKLVIELCGKEQVIPSIIAIRAAHGK